MFLLHLYEGVETVKSLNRVLIGTVVAASLTLTMGGGAYALDAAPDSGGQEAPAIQIDGTQSGDDLTLDEAEPAVLGPLVAAIIAAIAGGYRWGYNDGVARAASGQVTWSMFNSPWAWPISIAASGMGAVGIAGYQGWSHGFKTECAKHSYCMNR